MKNVAEPLVILRQPNLNLRSAKVEVALGQQLKLNCKAVGMPPPNYMWYHENSPITEQITEELNIQITK